MSGLRRLAAGGLCLGLAALAVPAAAEDAAQAISLQLNAAQPSEKGCRFTFVVNNGLGHDLSKASYEIALFNDAGIVDRLTVLEFKDLPVGKTKVARFDLAGVDCAKTTRLLVNTATDCVGDGVDPASCMRFLKTESKAAITFGI